MSKRLTTAFLAVYALGAFADPAASGDALAAGASRPRATIASYTTDEAFSSERQAEAAMAGRVDALGAAGITSLGGRTVKTDHDYSFVIDYVARTKDTPGMPPAVIVESYRNGTVHRHEGDAAAAMAACVANFRAAKVPVIGSYLYAVGNDNAFAVDYVVEAALRPTAEYTVFLEYYTAGQFTFLREAEESSAAYVYRFRQAGVPAIRAKAERRPDGDYTVEVEYAVRTNEYGGRPLRTVARYDSRETFVFEADALRAFRERLPDFTAAGVPPLSHILRREGRKYSYSVDYLVENRNRLGVVFASVVIEAYASPATFTFEDEATQAMGEKAAALNAAGLGVIGSAVSGKLGAFSYSVDYVNKDILKEDYHDETQPRHRPPGVRRTLHGGVR